MREWQSQAHVKHYCRYHVVFVLKYRKKPIYGTLRKDIGGIFKDLCRQYGIELVEGHAMGDHVHMLLMIPPKFSVANTIGFLKGKSAIRIFRDYLQVKQNFTGKHFWVRGYCVSTVGLDEVLIRNYIKNQELEEKRQEQMRLAGV
ncbi:IS200/IS605 family transposase [Pseudomonadota bacterium]